ncbi:MAG: hypothetical protein M3Y34_03270 [Actinomycetota bacterium]|nr:hypothetical protein [Actinomycetota bacterium]
MKRIVTLAAVAAAAVAPASSSAESTGLAAAARGGNDLRIKFDLVSVGNEPRRIENFEFRRFTVSCAVGGPVDVKGAIARMGINDAGRFDGNAKKGDAKVHVEGEVKQGGDKVVGILKSSGDFGGGAQNCRTTVGWKAS